MSFFEQKINYIDRGDRFTFFSNLIKDKRAMHYGCADWPVFDINTNLHYKLLQVNKDLVGYDIDRETIKLMKSLNEFKDCHLTTKKSKTHYDILLAPETIEHVFDIESFILEVSLITNTIVITAPNALCEQHYSRNLDNGSEWTEIVHPDHKYWFSPYTLMNSIRMVLDRNNIKHTIDEVGFLEARTMVYCKYSINE
jgi:hypothetical protein